MAAYSSGKDVECQTSHVYMVVEMHYPQHICNAYCFVCAHYNYTIYMLIKIGNKPPQMSLCLYIPSSFPGELNYLSCHHCSPCSSIWFVNGGGHCHRSHLRTAWCGCCCCYHCGCGAGCDAQKTWSREKILVS